MPPTRVDTYVLSRACQWSAYMNKTMLLVNERDTTVKSDNQDTYTYVSTLVRMDATSVSCVDDDSEWCVDDDGE